MKLYWKISSIPELKALPYIERKRIWKDCYRKAWTNWHVWLAFMIFPFIVLTVLLIAEVVNNYFPSLPFIVIPIFIWLYSFTGGMVFWQIVMRITHEYVKKNKDLQLET